MAKLIEMETTEQNRVVMNLLNVIYIIITIAKAYEDDLKSLSYSKAYMFDTVNERKNAFIELSDVMIFIPGGIGTIDELLTAIETRRNHEHSVPII